MSKSEYKIRLVAIAKDEAAYLPEWIFHHLETGIDSIHIYTNGISDNSIHILRKICQIYTNVRLIDADNLEHQKHSSIQKNSYEHALLEAKADGFEYLMWLDIDEFWTTRSFNNSIKEYLRNIGNPKYLVFPWAIKVDEKREFQPPFSTENVVRMDTLVKPIFSTSLEIKDISPHCITTNDTESILPDNSVLSQKGENIPRIKNKISEVPRAFILHRVTRSQMEYISLLARGRPYNKKARSQLKDNRWGYLKKENFDFSWGVHSYKIEKYKESYSKFVKTCEIENDIENAKLFVKERYHKASSMLIKENKHNPIKIDKLLKNIDLPDIRNKINSHKKSMKEKGLKKQTVKIIQIGFNKCGTSSIHDFIVRQKIKGVAWENGTLAKKIAFRIKKNQDPLTDYPSHILFTDMENSDLQLYPHKEYETFYKYYPNSYFILNIRNKNDWINSRLNHGGYLDKAIKYWDCGREEIIQAWSDEWDILIRNATEFFSSYERFTIFDIDNDNGEKLASFLSNDFDLDPKKYRHIGATKKT